LSTATKTTKKKPIIRAESEFKLSPPQADKQTVIPGTPDDEEVARMHRDDEYLRICTEMNVVQGEIRQYLDNLFKLSKKENFHDAFGRALAVKSFLRALGFLRDDANDYGRVVYYAHPNKRASKLHTRATATISVERDNESLTTSTHQITKEFLNHEMMV